MVVGSSITWRHPRNKVFRAINNKYSKQKKIQDIYSSVRGRICFYGPRISSKPRELYSLQWLLGDISFIIVHSSFMCFRPLLEARRRYYLDLSVWGWICKAAFRFMFGNNIFFIFKSNTVCDNISFKFQLKWTL